MTAIRNTRLAVALIRKARILLRAKSEQERRREVAEKARALIHGPPFTDQEREQALAEVEARRQ